MGEVFLFHGTHPIAAEKIQRENFRLNLAGSSTGTLYGRGIYLAEHCSKADEYAKASEDFGQTSDRTLLVCRVTLGKALEVKVVEPDPRECERICCDGPCHSVLGDRIACRGTFREYVVFDDDLAYPAFVVKYSRIS